ncbi:MAG: GGDEF domain-containing protein [Oscillospiraceae bacterium]|jgi:diguanylate cyclase (GGDEF)-like protein|nr:GGDEF domain-containing protein [Oscillospiraceae bacterium]
MKSEGTGREDAAHATEENLAALRQYAQALANGHLETVPPSGDGPLGAEIRALHGYLRQRAAVEEEMGRTMARVFNKLNMIVLVLDDRCRVLFANEAAVRFRLHHGGGQPGAGREDLLTNIILNHLPLFGASVFFESGDKRWYQIESAPVVWRLEKNAVLYTLLDVTEMKANEEVLRTAAEKDALTGVYRRDTGLSVFRDTMQKKGGHMPFVVSFLDIDNLKDINDKYGHQAGDAAIRGAADILRSSLRDTDVIIRAGGDEFIFILIGSDDQMANEIYARIFRRLEEFNHVKGFPFSLDFSIGMSRAATGASDIDGLIKNADAEMYARKRRKKELRYPFPEFAGGKARQEESV